MKSIKLFLQDRKSDKTLIFVWQVCDEAVGGE